MSNIPEIFWNQIQMHCYVGIVERSFWRALIGFKHGLKY